jgi:MtN3 and saliva related transmembrane protein
MSCWCYTCRMIIGNEHLHARKRQLRTLSPYPHPDALRRRLDTLMLVIGPLAPIALFPQVLEIYRTSDAGSFSLVTWTSFALINVLWALYGFLHKETPIILANGGLVVLNSAIVIGILLY